MDAVGISHRSVYAAVYHCPHSNDDIPTDTAMVSCYSVGKGDHAEDVISLVLSGGTILSFSAPQGFCIRPDQEWSLQLISI